MRTYFIADYMRHSSSLFLRGLFVVVELWENELGMEERAADLIQGMVHGLDELSLTPDCAFGAVGLY